VSGLWLEWHTFNESEMALFFECMQLCAQKVLDTADIVREAILRQLTRGMNKSGTPARKEAGLRDRIQPEFEPVVRVE
jgi:hypothetical protein